MKLVREHIIFEKFTEKSDPIRDMGIGLTTKQIVKMLLDEDKKTNLIGKRRTGKNNLYEIIIWSAGRGKPNQAGTRILLHFYADTFYVPGKTYKDGRPKRMTSKELIEYARSLFQNIGLGEMIIGGEANYHFPHQIVFHLTPKYRKILTPIKYHI
jgi:hypothetical protein